MGYLIFVQDGYKLSLLCPFYFALLSCQFAQMSFAELLLSCKGQLVTERQWCFNTYTSFIFFIEHSVYQSGFINDHSTAFQLLGMSKFRRTIVNEFTLL